MVWTIFLFCSSFFLGKTWKKINEHAYCVKVNTNMFGSKENLNEQYLFGLVDPEVEFEETYEDEDITSDDDDDDDKSYMQSPEADDVTGIFFIRQFKFNSKALSL